MALKNRLRSQRSKRLVNVVNDDCLKSEELKFSSSDSEHNSLTSQRKIRERYSTQELRRKSECYNIDNDHIYTNTRPSGMVTVRKRQFSEESDERLPKQKCFSKNAVMARLNRERKKKYVLSLEAENETLRKENDKYIQQMEKQNKEISVLRREVLYLKGLLANSKELELILRNLKDVTGLPVSSSILPSIQAKAKNELLAKSFADNQEQENRTLLEYQPRIRSVNSGYNYPILDKDINLGSFSENSCNAVADFENCPFHFNNDFYDTDSNFNTDSKLNELSDFNLDFGFEGSFKLDNLPENKDPQVGICLHINQKRISVELCSICNSKATTSPLDLPDDVL